MRGFKYARQETEQAYREGRFTDKKKRSFCGYAPDGSVHELLAGEDKMVQHDRVMEAAKGMCQGCAKSHFIGSSGKWHHVWKASGQQRCDCLHSAMWVCQEWHKKYHVDIQWTLKS